MALGEGGATVCCTGRTTADARSEYDWSETIEETPRRVDEAGGRGIAVRVERLERDELRARVGRIDAEHGRLEVVVNAIYGGEQLAQWNTPLW